VSLLIGYHGNNCENKCPEGTYGLYCKESCRCQHGAKCHHVTGECICKPGYQGSL